MMYRRIIEGYTLSGPLISILLCLHACGRGQSHSDLGNVYGEDSRIAADNPFIGRFDNGCTGYVVGGLFAIAPLHCFVEELPANTDQPNSDADRLLLRGDIGYFRPGLKDGKSNHKALPERIWYATKDPIAHRELDWAIIQLNDNLEKKLGGFLRLANYNAALRLPLEVRLNGYSGDPIDVDSKGNLKPLPSGKQRRLGYSQSEDKSCMILQANEARTLVLHSCDVTGGGSGSPLFRQTAAGTEILAMHVADFPGEGGTSYKEEIIFPKDPLGRKVNANIAVPVSNFADKFEEIIRLYDSQKAVDWSALGLNMDRIRHDAAAIKPEIDMPKFNNDNASNNDQTSDGTVHRRTNNKPYRLGFQMRETSLQDGTRVFRITEFAHNSPAQLQGMKYDDLIEQVDGRSPKSEQELINMVANSDGELKIRFWRRDAAGSDPLQREETFHASTETMLYSKPRTTEKVVAPPLPKPKPISPPVQVQVKPKRWAAIAYYPHQPRPALTSALGYTAEEAINLARRLCGSGCGYNTVYDGCTGMRFWTHRYPFGTATYGTFVQPVNYNAKYRNAWDALDYIRGSLDLTCHNVLCVSEKVVCTELN